MKILIFFRQFITFTNVFTAMMAMSGCDLAQFIKYKQTSFFSSKLSVCMQFTTSGNRALQNQNTFTTLEALFSFSCKAKSKQRLVYLTSLPTVMLAITFLTASFFFSFLSLLSSALSSKISPFFVVVKYLESVILAIGAEVLTYSALFLFCYSFF